MSSFTGQNWETMSSYSHQWGKENKSQVEIDEAFLLLATLLEKKTNIYWHINYLQKYSAEKIILFGLRLKLFLHFKNPTTDFKTQWEDRLTQRSLDLMSLLIDEHRAEIKLIDIE